LTAAVLAVAVVPFGVVLLSGFVKFSVVLAILRRAFGGSMVPPWSVAGAVALLFALFVSAPVGEKVWAAALPAITKGDAVGLIAAAPKAAEPVKSWLEQHTPARERASFVELARSLRPAAERAAVGERDLMVLAPAFVTAELKAAFQVGFLLFLPFLVLDLVCAAILLSVGMTTVRTETIALPFKLLLFVAADGWHLVFRGLVQSYT
jgi:type III secretion protein R